MATLRIKGRDAEAEANAKLAVARDRDALIGWGGIVLDLYEVLSAYVPLRERWTRMEGWLKANRSDPRWPQRYRKCNQVYRECLAPGGLFDDLDKVLVRLQMAHGQLSDQALMTLESDYGVTMETPEHAFLTNLMIDHAPSDLAEFMNAWAIAAGGHAKEGMGECPF